MRIVSGRNKGKILYSPEGLTTRPTSDRARQAVFNILLHASWLVHDPVTDAPLLDVYAGTGALGLEAMSRGAQHAVFMEQDRAALSALRKNIDSMGLGSQSHILAQDARHPPRRSANLAPRQLVFLDPPYNKDKISPANLGHAALAALARADWLAPGCVCVQEMAKKFPEPVPQGFTLHDERAYGVALLRFMTFDGQDSIQS